MRNKVKVGSPDVALTRLLEALGQELIDASDEEIMAAAKDLGMDPKMRGSAAFAGLKYPFKAQLSDFFYELEAYEKLRAATERIASATQPEPKRKSRRAEISTNRKDPADK